MYGLFIILTIMALAGLIGAMVTPELFSKPFQMSLSKMALGGIYGALFLSSTIAVAATAPTAVKINQSVDQTSDEQTIDTSAKNALTTPAPTTTSIPQPSQLAADQKINILSIASANTDHYKKLWQDGLDALGATQYPNANAGLTALEDPNSSASKFSRYQQSENPANDNSINTEFQKADANYKDTAASDDALNNWRMDTIQLSSDSGLWVQHAVSWQISEIPTSQLNEYKQTVVKDFAQVQQDLQALSH
jgi:hypothetical protein